MKYKITVLMILTILLFICSLSTISAANQTITDTSTGGIAQGITDTEDKGTLYLEEGTYNKTGEDTNININKNITIQGKGPKDKVIIDAQKLSRIFTIGNNLNVKFINITFINGHATNGGAIYNNYANTSMTFINCTFTNNNASSTGSGGSIYNRGDNSNIINSNFTNNHARTAGAIYNGGINVTISNNNFINNNVNHYGSTSTAYGTAAAIQSNGNNATISNNNFTNNYAETNAGGLVVSSGILDCIVSNNIFINNTAKVGGAIYNNGHRTIISNNIFINNTALIDSGAIRRNNGENVVILNNSFINNTAIRYGGAISININAENLTISNNSFINNTASIGGAIYNNNLNVNIIIISNDFVNNIATNDGGAIYNEGTLEVMYNRFLNNSNSSRGVVFNSGSIIADYNWWGYNTPTRGVDYDGLDLNTWFVAKLTTSAKNATNSSKVPFFYDFYLTNSAGDRLSSDSSLLPYFVFTILGTDLSGDARVSNTYQIPINGTPGSVIIINGEVDNQLFNIPLNILKTPTNKTIDVAKNLKVGKKTTLESRLTDKDGNPIANATIDFYVNGKKVGSAITDSNGIARLDHIFTKAGSYNVQAKYAGNDTYEASSATGQTTVSKTKTNLEITVKDDKITATLTDEDGNPLTNKEIIIKVNGQTFIGTTDSNGQVIIKFPNANKYKVTAKFSGDDQYTPSSATVPGESEPNEPTSAISFSGKIAMKSTGIPIIAILLTLIASIALILRKKRLSIRYNIFYIDS